MLYGTDRVESARGIGYNDDEGRGFFVTDGDEGVISFEIGESGLVESITWNWLP